MSQDRIFRVKFYIIMIVCVCSSEKVKRQESGDEVTGSEICSTCTCEGTLKTYYNEPGNKKCINATQTGCQFQVRKYTSDIPTVTQSMLQNEVFQVTKVGSDLCPDGFTPSTVRILALTGSWEEVPAFMSNSSSISVIVLSAQLEITFRKIWHGLLIRIAVGCEEPGGGEYAPGGNCVLFKYAGSIEYPVTLSSFEETNTASTTPKTPKTTTKTTPPPTTSTATTASQSTFTTTSKSTLKTSAKNSFSSASEATPSPNTSTVTTFSLQPTTGTKKSSSKVAMVAGIAATVVVLLLIIIIILICYKRKLDRRKSDKKVEYSKANGDENIYDQLNQPKDKKEQKIEFANESYGNKISLYEDLNVSRNKTKNEKQDSQYCNTNDVNGKTNYYNVAGNQTSSNESDVPKTSEYDEIWNNNSQEKPKVDIGKSKKSVDSTSQNSVNEASGTEENPYIIAGGV